MRRPIKFFDLLGIFQYFVVFFVAPFRYFVIFMAFFFLFVVSPGVMAGRKEELLYNKEKKPIFIGLERSRGQSIFCHIHWLARACQCILVSKIRLLVFFPFRFCFSKGSLIIIS